MMSSPRPMAGRSPRPAPLPLALARVAAAIRANLPPSRRSTWPWLLAAAIPPGADLAPVPWRIMAAALRDMPVPPGVGLASADLGDRATRAAVERTIDLLEWLSLGEDLAEAEARGACEEADGALALAATPLAAAAAAANAAAATAMWWGRADMTCWVVGLATAAHVAAASPESKAAAAEMAWRGHADALLRLLAET